MTIIPINLTFLYRCKVFLFDTQKKPETALFIFSNKENKI